MGFWESAGQIGTSLVETGAGFVGMKYQSDLQGHMIDQQAQYNADQAREAWNRQIAENQRVYQENLVHEQQVWDRNTNYQKGMWEEQKKYDAKMTAEERQYNLDMWNKQNEYNSPAAQMERLKQAGLNPRLIYGQGNVGNAVAVSNAKPLSSEPQGMSPQGGVDLSTASAGYAGKELNRVGDYTSIVRDALNLYTRMRQVGMLRKQMEFNERFNEEKLRGQKLQNDMDEHDLEIYRKTGRTRTDSSTMKTIMGIRNYFGDYWDKSKMYGWNKAKQYDEWIHKPEGVDWEEAGFAGAPVSILSDDNDSHPLPLDIVEPSWFRYR